MKVKIYWVSATVNVKYGGIRKKSKASTLNKETRIEGTNPQLIAVTVTQMR